MSHGLLQLLRYFLLALIWLFFIYAVRMVFVEVRRSRIESRPDEGVAPGAGPRERGGQIWLRVVEPPELRSNAYEVNGELTLGRSANCAVALGDDTFASSMHARVFPHEGELWVEDLGSTNGTFLNNHRLAEPARLKRGDRIKVGNTVLEVAR